MKTRRATTILLITRDRLIRADLRAGGRAAAMAVQEGTRPMADDFPSLVEAALRLSPRRPGRVWVLSSEFWTQTLGLASESVAGLKGEETDRALAFEAEPFSGLAAMESAVGHVALPGASGQRQFWLIQLPSRQLDDVQYAVERSGGSLCGLCHAAGLPRRLSPAQADSADWQRAELWPGLVLRVRGGRGRQAAVEVRNVDPKPGRWEADVCRWQSELPPGRTEILLAARGIRRADVEPGECLSLDDDQSMRRFLGAWAEELASGTASVPVIPAVKRPVSAASRLAMAAVAGLCTLLICLGISWAAGRYQQDLATRTAALKAPAERLNQLKEKAKKLEARRDQLRAACDKLQAELTRCRQVLSSQRLRLALLLDVLARQANDDFAIRKIDGNESEIVLHGVCLRHDLVDSLACSIDAELAPQGWRAQLVDKHSKGLLANGGPWEFDLRIRDSFTQGSNAARVADSQAAGRGT
jgi:hypothetical protein